MAAFAILEMFCDVSRTSELRIFLHFCCIFVIHLSATGAFMMIELDLVKLSFGATKRT